MLLLAVEEVISACLKHDCECVCVSMGIYMWVCMYVGMCFMETSSHVSSSLRFYPLGFQIGSLIGPDLTS